MFLSCPPPPECEAGYGPVWYITFLNKDEVTDLDAIWK